MSCLTRNGAFISPLSPCVFEGIAALELGLGLARDAGPVARRYSFPESAPDERSSSRLSIESISS